VNGFCQTVSIADGQAQRGAGLCCKVLMHRHLACLCLQFLTVYSGKSSHTRGLLAAVRLSVRTGTARHKWLCVPPVVAAEATRCWQRNPESVDPQAIDVPRIGIDVG
jgi:hypothetical protein